MIEAKTHEAYHWTAAANRIGVKPDGQVTKEGPRLIVGDRIV